MRYARIWAGCGAVLVAVSASMASAAVLQRGAAAKALGQMEGGSETNRGPTRAFSYAPSTSAPSTSAPIAANPAPVETPQPSANAQSQDSSTRSFSYQGAPVYNPGVYRQGVAGPRYTHAERKALGEY